MTAEQIERYNRALRQDILIYKKTRRIAVRIFSMNTFFKNHWAYKHYQEELGETVRHLVYKHTRSLGIVSRLVWDRSCSISSPAIWPTDQPGVARVACMRCTDCIEHFSSKMIAPALLRPEEGLNSQNKGVRLDTIKRLAGKPAFEYPVKEVEEIKLGFLFHEIETPGYP